MSTLYLRNLSTRAHEKLKARAARNRRSVNAEAVAIIEEAVLEEDLVEERREALRRIDERRHSYTPPPEAVDSLTLLREDRDR